MSHPHRGIVRFMKWTTFISISRNAIAVSPLHMSMDENNEFYKKLDVYYKDKPGKRPYSIDEINSMIQSLIEAKLNKNKKTRREYYLLEKFDVLNIAEKHFLISKQKDKNNEEIKREYFAECCVETDSAEAILCNLCETNIKINEARHLGAAGIEKQAEKMLQDSKTKTPEFKVGDCVVIPVPKVDRGPADPANIVAVVIDQKNDLNRLGTEQGIIKGWYGSGNIQLATSRFIDIKQVNKVKEMSLREIVSSLTGGQAVIVRENVKQKNVHVLKVISNVILVAIIHYLQNEI
ncbi:hypothetical protein AGLY_002822 [Aphis glycines]|uniref:Uncharacterized protein n=1 Tax=Aphis glycines TaxID=307491 RepID=A0A6G0U1C0_APHGL|nr:hypothetical protein AGLY_002822 [Aphis glycines]